MPISKQAKELVIERIKASSSQLKVSIGAKNYTKKELLTSVRQENRLGKKVVNAQLKYLRDLASGKIYKT